MTFYLAWGIMPAIAWWALVLWALVEAWKHTEWLRIKKRVRALLLVGGVFLAQIPIHHDSTHYQKYRLTFDKGVEYNGQQIERDEQRETWQSRSERVRLESNQSANERTNQALKGE